MANICIMNGYVSLLFCGLASDIAMDDILQYWIDIIPQANESDVYLVRYRLYSCCGPFD